jgi:hypothetical protein
LINQHGYTSPGIPELALRTSHFVGFFVFKRPLNLSDNLTYGIFSLSFDSFLTKGTRRKTMDVLIQILFDFVVLGTIFAVVWTFFPSYALYRAVRGFALVCWMFGGDYEAILKEIATNDYRLRKHYESDPGNFVRK